MMTRLAGSLVALSLLAVGGCSEPVQEGAIIRPVRYTVVESSDTARERTFSGVAGAGSSSVLSFQVSGRVLEVPVGVGDRVREGELIARIDPADFELELQNARANAARMRAQEQNARANYRRTRALYENQNASIQDLETDETNYQSARAAALSANQQVRLLRRQLDYTVLRSPAAGTIAAVDGSANENIDSGDPVATLIVGDKINVNVSVPGSYIRSIREGDPVRVRFSALPQKSLKGVVTEVGVSTVGSRTTYPVTVELTEGLDLVRAGMPGAVTFSFARQEGAPDISLPITSVGEDSEGRFVFVVESGEGNLGTVHRRPVEVGKLASDGVEILGGVEPGQFVVTAGLSYLSDGLEVRVPPQPGTSPDNVAGPTEREAPAEAPQPEPGAP